MEERKGGAMISKEFSSFEMGKAILYRPRKEEKEKVVEEEKNIEMLPPEIMELIFMYCIETPKDIIQLAHTSNYFYSILNEHPEHSKRIWWTIHTNSYPVGIVLLKHMPPLNRFKHYQKRINIREYMTIMQKTMEYAKEHIMTAWKKPPVVQQMIGGTRYIMKKCQETAHNIKEKIKRESKLFNKITYYYDDGKEGEKQQRKKSEIEKRILNQQQQKQQQQEKQQQNNTIETLYKKNITVVEDKNKNTWTWKDQQLLTPLVYMQLFMQWASNWIQGKEKKQLPQPKEKKETLLTTTNKVMKRVGSYSHLYENNVEKIQHGPYSSIASFIQTQQSLKLLKSVENSSANSFAKVHHLHCTLTTALRYIVPLFPILEMITFFMLVFEHFDYTYYVLSTLYHAIGVCWMLKITLCFIEIVYCKPTAYVGKYRSLHTSSWTFLCYIVLSSFFFYLSGYIREGTWLEVMVVLMVGNIFVAILYMVDSPTFVKFGEISQFIVSLLAD